jgi:hypothetical protein
MAITRTWILNKAQILSDRFDLRSRTKRAPLEIIGDLSSSLFGLARQSDIRILAKANEQLASNLDGVVQTQQTLVGKVNLIGHNQQALADKLSEVVGGMNYNRQELQRISVQSNRLASLQHQTRIANELSLILDILDIQMNMYQDALHVATSARAACEAGIVTEKLVPKQILQQVLTSRANRVAMDPSAYYQYMSVKQIAVIEDTTYCIIQAPLMSREPQFIYHLNTFPVCNSVGCYCVY